MKLISAIIAAFLICGCQTMHRTIKKADHSHDYLKSERYQGHKMNVPKELSSSNIHERYPVPEVPGEDSLSVPTINPPLNIAMGNS